MASWTGIAFALTEPEGDGLSSRLATYLHPIAGRPLVWHSAAAVAALGPSRILLVTTLELPADRFSDLPGTFEVVDPRAGGTAESLRRAGAFDDERIFLFNAAAPFAPPPLPEIISGPSDLAIVGVHDDVAALWTTSARALDLADIGALDRGIDSAALAGFEVTRDPRPGTVVRTRAGLTEAGIRIRDMLVARLMEAGVTFLLPQTVLVDVDVRIGPDTVVYPGAVLEGQTTIGEETVLGPGCRIIDSWIGSGVELKGYNYISHTSIRNRAIVEAHVRRGFD